MSRSTSTSRRSITRRWRRSSAMCSASRASSSRNHGSPKLWYTPPLGSPHVNPMTISSPVLGLDASSLPARGEATLRRWIYRLGLLTAVLSAAALIVGLATLSGISQGVIFWPASMLLAGMALLAGVASVVANRVHDVLARRVDVLAHALEAS